jgi:hypothetical protein
MSYIINKTDPFINIKLTDLGRQKLSQGKLNFSFWAIGDSEIDYNREFIVDNYSDDASLSGTSKILRPFDQQNDMKSYITSQSNGNNNLNQLLETQINTLRIIANNKAQERGFFSGDGVNFITYTADTYVKSTGIISNSLITGGTSILIGTGYTFSVNDNILFKLTNDTIGDLTLNTNSTPTPNLWFKIQSINTTFDLNDTITVDRSLPNLNSVSANTQFFIYTGGEVYGEFGFEETTPYWNTNTLSFNNSCDISCGDVPVWNMNNIFCADLIGMTGTGINDLSTPYENFYKFGSSDFLGQKNPYMEYPCFSDELNNLVSDVCNTPGQSVLDSTVKSISIIHYTNNTISNFYGEFFYIDGEKNKNLEIHLPTLMYHRRNFSTESGTTMGMKFIATGETKTFGTNQIEYVELIEEPTMVSDEPRIIGIVLPKLKMIVISDDEIVAAMSYKSNRNWTLPEISCNLIASSSGINGGILEPNKIMYLTYVLANDTTDGLTTTLPCQYISKISNTTSSTKDVQFRLSNIDLLPYMRKTEKLTYDGMGFYAKNFKVLYQITDDGEIPLANNWNSYDFTSDLITSVSGETIDPILFENQNPVINGFLIDSNINTSATTYSIMASLNMPLNSTPEILQFGDERFFYGNLSTYIGANIYKTLFNINISGDEFVTTSNPTRLNTETNNSDIRLSEIGIYDSEQSLVMIGKPSKPITLKSGKTIMIELGIDF